MNWKDLESLIHDNYAVIDADQAEKFSKQLLAGLDDQAKPLQGAKIAYALVLIQLKSEQGSDEKALKFLQYLDTILKHELEQTQTDEHEHAEGHLAYVLKLADHYFHHIAVVAELKKAEPLTQRAQRLRGRYHEKLAELHQTKPSLASAEKRLIASTLNKHYVVAGLLLALAIGLGWTSFWKVSDYAMAQWVFSDPSVEDISEMMIQGFTLIFAGLSLFGLLRYAFRREPSNT